MRSSTKRSLDNRHLKCAAWLTPMPFHTSWNMRASRYARAGADNSSSGSRTITTLYSTDMTLAEPLRLRPTPKNGGLSKEPPGRHFQTTKPSDRPSMHSITVTSQVSMTFGSTGLLWRTGSAPTRVLRNSRSRRLQSRRQRHSSVSAAPSSQAIMTVNLAMAGLSASSPGTEKGCEPKPKYRLQDRPPQQRHPPQKSAAAVDLAPMAGKLQTQPAPAGGAEAKAHRTAPDPGQQRRT